MSDTLVVTIAGMSCGHCVATVERALSTVAGVTTADVRVGRAELTLAPTAERQTTESSAIEAIRRVGFDVTSN